MKDNDILKIGTFSILSYLIFRISHFILINLLLLLNLKLQISSITTLFVSSVIITIIIPLIILIIGVNKSIFKPIIPTLKNILLLFIILIIMTFIDEGIELSANLYRTDLELGEFRNTYLEQYAWTKGSLYLLFLVIAIIFIPIKLGAFKREDLENKSQLLKIGLMSVLCYLVFEKTYAIMTIILTWIYSLKIDNEFIILSINILFGLFSILILKSMFNRFLKNKIPSKKDIYILLTIGIFMVFLLTGNNFLIIEYFDNKPDMDFSNYKQLSQLSWSKELNYLVKFSGLTYLIWKIYSERKTVANTVYN